MPFPERVTGSELKRAEGTGLAGTARLRKRIETENFQMTVPIRRKKARLVVEPIPEANADVANSGGDLTTGGARNHQPRVFYDRKLAEGHTPREAIRSLKRRLSDIAWRHLVADAQRAARP